jgi:hypothetical protein
MTSKKTTQTRTNRLTIQATDQQGNSLPIIGTAMAWKYSKSEYDQDKVIDAFRLNNLDTDHITKGAERIEAVKRAVRKAKEKGLLREILPGRYQLTEETLNDMGGSSVLEYNLKEVIVYDESVTPARFLFEDAQGVQTVDDARSDALMARVKHCECVFVNSDITRYTKKLFEDKGIVSLRDGLYFIPAKFNDLVKNTKSAFNLIDPSGMFMLIEIPDTEGSCAAVGASAADMVKEKVRLLKEKLGKHKEERAKKIAEGTSKRGKFEGPVRLRVGETQLSDIAAIAGDVELLAECLGFDLEDCQNTLAEYKQELLGELGVETEEEFRKNRENKRTNKKEKFEDDDFSPDTETPTTPDVMLSGNDKQGMLF